MKQILCKNCNTRTDGGFCWRNYRTKIDDNGDMRPIETCTPWPKSKKRCPKDVDTASDTEELAINILVTIAVDRVFPVYCAASCRWSTTNGLTIRCALFNTELWLSTSVQSRMSDYNNGGVIRCKQCMEAKK